MRRFSSPLTTTLIQSTILNALANILAQLIDQYKHHDLVDNERRSTFKFTLNTTALIQFTIYGIIVVPINFVWQKAIEDWYPGFPGSRSSSSSSSSPPTPSTTTATTGIGRRFRPRFTRGFLFRQGQGQDHGYGYGHGLGGRGGLLPMFSFPSFSSSSPFSSTSTATVKEKPAAAVAASPAGGTSSSSSSSSSSGFKNFLAKFFLDQTVGSVVNIILFIVLINMLKGVDLRGILALVKEDFYPLMLARLAYRPVVSGLMYGIVPMEKRVVFGCACGVIWGVYLSLYAAV